MWFRAPVRDLTGKNVLVTGAASGIGRSAAEQAAARGAVVHLTDIQADLLAEVAESIRATGGQYLSGVMPLGKTATSRE